MMYKASIRPHCEYCINIYKKERAENLKTLEITLNRVIGELIKLQPQPHVAKILKDFNIFTLNEVLWINIWRSGRAMWYNLAPRSIKGSYIPAHSLQTRSKNAANDKIQTGINAKATGL